MKKFYNCDFCDGGLVVPNNHVDKYLVEFVENFNNKYSEKALVNISILAKISYRAEIMLETHYPDIYAMLSKFPFPFYSSTLEDVKITLSKRFLDLQPSTQNYCLTKCDSCSRMACGFHELHGGFSFYKCSLCNKYVSICGWCSEYTSHFLMISYGYCKDCQNVKNKQKKTVSEEILATYFDAEEINNKKLVYVSLDVLDDDAF